MSTSTVEIGERWRSHYANTLHYTVQTEAESIASALRAAEAQRAERRYEAEQARRTLTYRVRNIDAPLPHWTDWRTITEPQARWIRVRNEMRNHMLSANVEGGERARTHIVNTLMSLPNVWSETAYAMRMADIRQAGIDAHNADLICFSGTNDFFREFDIDEMFCSESNRESSCGEEDCGECNTETDYRVTVMVEVTFTVSSSEDMADVRYNVERNISADVDTSYIDGDVGYADVEVSSVSVDYV